MIHNLAVDDTGDLLIEACNIAQVEGVDAIAQAVQSDLRTVYGEYWLDVTLGVQYFEVVFNKNVDLSFVDSLLRNAILKRDDVLEIISYESEFTSATRDLSVVYSAQTTEGVISEESVTL